MRKEKNACALTGVRLAAWQMRGGGGQSDGTQKREIDAQMELRRTKERMMVDNRKNKEEEAELGANVLKKWRCGEWYSLFVCFKKEPSATFRRLPGRCCVVDSQADRSLCAQQLKLLPNKKIIKGRALFVRWLARTERAEEKTDVCPEIPGVVWYRTPPRFHTTQMRWQTHWSHDVTLGKWFLVISFLLHSKTGVQSAVASNVTLLDQILTRRGDEKWGNVREVVIRLCAFSAAVGPKTWCDVFFWANERMVSF